ncbi:class I SAM-dependent DNA methyltransferase [Pseudoflavonifractor phocaeensis]|uniref:class I SAM-dependent DNA methyltransferase n=1 Tax=Pseudoflavonifractor phocaeensis TaxID=1870988 RepID=UPI00210DED2C|nr:class I SAM-dependent methyltransferase [Pseudoflavonifractor phocaeensis]MCQ4864998.1 methyltransferase [Pseudoflavonifractor phocaeensis]
MYFNDEKAAGWDTPERTRRAAALVEEIRKEFGDARGKTALEIGSGTGLLTFGLCPYFMEICTADTAAAMQKALGEKLAGAGIKNVRPIEVKDLEGEAYRGKFDLIYSSMVFHHIRDIAGELALVTPLLKKGGTFLLIDLDAEDGRFHREDKGFDGYNGFDRAWMAAELERAGLREVSVRTAFTGVKRLTDGDVPYSLFLMRGEKP